MFYCIVAVSCESVIHNSKTYLTPAIHIDDDNVTNDSSTTTTADDNRTTASATTDNDHYRLQWQPRKQTTPTAHSNRDHIHHNYY
jgi:hypothetical protein